MSKLNLTTKRFVIRKSLIGENKIITFTNNKKETFTYDHDEVFANNQERLLSMSCFNEYGSYTNSNKIPNWVK